MVLTINQPHRGCAAVDFIDNNREIRWSEKLRKLLRQGHKKKTTAVVVSWSGRRGSNSRPSAWKADALSTELLPQCCWWVVMDSNHRSRKTADLQSAPFGRSGNYPLPFKRCKVTIIYWFLQHQRRKKLNFLYKNRQIAVANTLFGTLPIYALRKKRPTMGNFAITRSRCSTR